MKQVSLRSTAGKAVRAAIRSMNGSEAGRQMLYASHLRSIRRLTGAAPSVERVLRFYEKHLQTLKPFFEKTLALNTGSQKLAEECDSAFISSIHQILESIPDPKSAKQLNKAIHDFEHQRKLERMAAYPHRMYLELTDACNLK